MKRQMIIGLMLAAAFTLTNCSEQNVAPDLENDIIVDETIENNTSKDNLGSIPYEVYVNEPTTKTIASGGNTYWVDEATALANGLDKDAVDRVTIYTLDAYPDSKSYTCHGKYTYAGNRKFVGDLLLGEGEIENWYCLYPYVSSVAAIQKNNIEETFIFGASADENYVQIQYGENNTDHIAGKNYPMYGTTTENNKNAPTFAMSHLSSLVEIKIVNETGNPVEIEQIELISTTNPIVGEFNVALDDDGSPVVSNPDNDNQSKTAILRLGENGSGALIAAGTDSKHTEAKFYLAVAPVEDVFTIRINGTAIANSSTIALPSGKKTTLKISIPKLVGIQEFSTRKEGVEFIKWDNTHDSKATINGKTGLDIYTVSNGLITIKGTIDQFLGSEASNSALPLSFYAASKTTKNNNYEYVDESAILEIANVSMYANINVADVFEKTIERSFSGSSLSEKMQLPTSFKLMPIGSFSSNENNLIVLCEADNYYYVNETKANTLIHEALDDENDKILDENGNDIGSIEIQDFRKAIYQGDYDAWTKLRLLARRLAPGQFGDLNGSGEDTTLGSLLNLLCDNKTLREFAGPYIQAAEITIVLQSSGDAVCWGLNVHSTGNDIK